MRQNHSTGIYLLNFWLSPHILFLQKGFSVLWWPTLHHLMFLRLPTVMSFVLCLLHKYLLLEWWRIHPELMRYYSRSSWWLHRWLSWLRPHYCGDAGLACVDLCDSLLNVLKNHEYMRLIYVLSQDCTMVKQKSW